MSIAEETGTRKLAAIMFTDIKGFSRKMGENETVAMALLRAHDAMMNELVAKHGGKVIKSIGDSFMVDFSSAVNAVKCAIEAQQIFWYYNKGKTELEKIEIRVGIHLGDVITDGTDIYGDGVNIASRIETITQPNRICVSQDIYNQIRNKMPVQAYSLGPVEFKNIAEPIEVFEILIDSIPELAKPSQASVPVKAQKKLEAETKREAEEAERVEAAKHKVDEDALKVEQEQQKNVQQFYAEAERLFDAGRLGDAERQISEIFKIVALHAGAQLLQMKIEEARFRKSEEERIRKSEVERKLAQEREQRIEKLLGEANQALEAGLNDDGLAAVRALLEMDPEHEQARALEKTFLDALALQAELAKEKEVVEAPPAEPVTEEETKPKPALKKVVPPQVRAKRRKQIQLILASLIAAAVVIVGLILVLPGVQSILFPLGTSLAVLPFQTADAQPENAYLGVALAALLTDEFARVEQLTTIAPTSAASARAAGLSTAEMAREFSVGFVLRGEVQEQEKELQVSARLQSLEKGTTVLSRSYTIGPEEIPQLRSLIVKDVLQAMELERPAPSVLPLSSQDRALRYYLSAVAGFISVDSARVRAALGDFRRALAEDTLMADAAAGVGAASLRLYHMGGETDPGLLREAQDYSQSALRLRQDVPLAYQTLGGVLRCAQRTGEARQALDHVLETKPGSAEALRQLALVNLMEGENSAAVRDAGRALRLDPRNPFSHMILGIVQHLTGNHESALASYNMAVELGAPDSLLTMRYRIPMWIATGRSELALTYVRRMMEQYPRDYRTYYWVGQVLQLSGKALDSQPFLESADLRSRDIVTMNTSDVETLLFRALILSRKGDFADAMAELERAESLAPGSARVLYRKANVLWIQNKKEEALRALRSAVGRELQFPEVASADLVFLARDPEFASAIVIPPATP